MVELLDQCLNKTLGEIDRRGIFRRAEASRKITGIAGDVIEQSVFGCTADNKQKADFLVDGLRTELKTTGLRYSKKEKGKYEAEEPVTITAVSPDTIVTEEFAESHFWQKLAHLLFVYYLYDSPCTVPAAEYARFPVKGYEFHEFSPEDRDILRSDWMQVRDFIAGLQRDYADYEAQYPRISHDLRKKLLYIDTAPKWPHHPRFRLRREFVTSIVREHFGEKLEQLSGQYASMSDIDQRLHDKAEELRGDTVEKLLARYHIKQRATKGLMECVVVRMFGGQSKRLNKVGLFRKAGLIARTDVLAFDGGKTEDMKLFMIGFDEIRDVSGDEEEDFRNSSFYEWFQKEMLCIMFHEPRTGKHVPLREAVFDGFKRLEYSEEFIEKEVRGLWNELRQLVNGGQLQETFRRKKDGSIRCNKTGLPQQMVNFPKASQRILFVRGSGTDSGKKPEVVNGICMYRQYVWIRGQDVAELLKDVPYI